MDKELFDYCLDLFKKTGWDRYTLPNGKEQWINEAWWTLYGTQMPYPVDRIKIMSDQFVCPLYTIEYLLERLPHIKDVDFRLEQDGFDDNGACWVAYGVDYTVKSENNNLYWSSESTPLKALLKLVIALHEAGEIK